VATIFIPRYLHIGGGCSNEIGVTLKRLGFEKPIIVTDRYMTSIGRAECLQDALQNAGIMSRVFDGTVADPTSSSIYAGLDCLKGGDYDCVIGFGGGSSIDSAKAIAVLAVHGGEVAHYRAAHVQDVAGLPIIAIPTTAGTGSEVSRFTVVTDEQSQEKMLLTGTAYLPVAALVDYELTLSMPRRLTADCGIDALAHAIESFVSKRANLFSDGMALSAISNIAPNLRKVWDDPLDHDARSKVMMGATQAGIAMSNSSVTLVHGMSRPLGMHFHVPHGLSNAILLPIVTDFSLTGALSRYAQCARAMGIGESDDHGDNARRLVEELCQLNVDLNIPKFSDLGLDRIKWDDLIPEMARQALASGSPSNNPIVPDASDIEALYTRLTLN
jgi:alcohol dehydrogenase class IV